MKPTFDSKYGFHAIYPPCDDMVLKSFERTLLGGELPEDYRDFLLQWNGGNFEAFKSIAFPLADDWLDDDYGYIDHLAGLFDESNELDLRNSSSAYGFRAAVPASYISIGDYGDWNQVCISVQGNDVGAVYYWQPGEPWPKEKAPTTRALRPVAKCFSEFWNLLFEEADEL